MTNRIHRFIVAALAAAIFASGLSAAFGQASSPAITQPLPILITAGNTFQVLRPGGESRRALTIQNNNASDDCRLLIGGPWVAGDTTATSRAINGVTVTASQGSILLSAGSSYTRYLPYIPSDQLLVTCTTAGDSIYLDLQ